MIKNKITKPKVEKKLKLNIAMIGQKRIPSREGGVEIVVEELSTRLVKLGHKVTSYNRRGHHVSGREFDGNCNISQINEYKGIKIVTVPTIEGKGLAAVTSSFFATLKAIFGNYDCIHYHAEGPSVMLLLANFTGIRTVVTIHGLDWQRAKWGRLAKSYLKFCEKIAIKYADEVIVLSKNLHKYFRDTYGRETVFIPNGIVKPVMKPVELIKQHWNLEKDEYILFLGRIVPEKGLQYLIDAYLELNTSKKLVIAGGASDTDEYMLKIKNKAIVDNRIVFTDFVQGQDLEELYSNAYLYVLPSDLEGMPISLLEAMSYGNCCVVSDIPECVEVVGENAVIFRRGDVLDLRNKLDKLCSNPVVVDRYKEKASEYILNKYNWDNVVNLTLNLYKS